jgi:hypothetical protein
MSKRFPNTGVRSSTDEFVAKAITVHGTKFNYSGVLYVNAKTKVEIGCSVHGPFLQRPNDHLSGVGCGRCGQQVANATRRQKGIISLDPKAIDVYRRRVRHLSLKTYEKHYQLINPLGLPRGNDFHLDHKLSIVDGFNAGISEGIMSSWQNLTILPANQNRSKSSKSSISVDELVKLITTST